MIRSSRPRRRDPVAGGDEVGGDDVAGLLTTEAVATGMVRTS